MNKLFKTFSLLFAVLSAVPMVAMDPNKTQPGDVVGTIGGDITRVKEGDVIRAIDRPLEHVTSEKEEKKNESKLQRLRNFVWENRDTIQNVCFCALFVGSLYYMLFVKIPQCWEAQEQASKNCEVYKKVYDAIDEVKAFHKKHD
jgi:hypothetical protein